MKGLSVLFLLGALGIAFAEIHQNAPMYDAKGRGLTLDLLGLGKKKAATSNPFGPAQHSAEGDAVKFKMYTSTSLHSPLIVSSTKNLQKATTKFNKEARVKMIIPDWQYEDGTQLVPAQNIKNAYASQKRPENLIIVDWTGISSNFEPGSGIDLAKKAGKKVAEFISSLIKEGLVKSPKDIDIIGLGGGAQVAAIVGAKVHKKENATIARITALDPTGPGFDAADTENRLDESDADFVDVLHCNHFDANAGGLFKSWWAGGKERFMGTNEVVGNIDTYINGGFKQPGCDGIMGHLDSCSHTRCFDLYTLSVKGYRLMACECEDWNTYLSGSCDCKNGPLIGEPTFANETGVHYIKTTATAHTIIPTMKKGNGTGDAEDAPDVEEHAKEDD